jgi:hypothetical protein
MAENLSIQQLQQSIQDGVLPSYIGVPLLKSKVEDAKLLQAAKAAQSMSQQPSVAQQIMSQAQQVEQGVPGLQSNLPVSMAGGGIVAFAGGGMYDEEDTDEDRQDAERQAEMDEMMDEYAQSFQSGIGQLPAAQQAAPQGGEGIASGDAADFVSRIMHKESRGRRYGKDGQLLTSEKGAQGEMQVMPGTSRDPGYGVKAARDGSPDELARVGRDYANTLLERYGDPKLAAIAYNMGPGATDKWLAAGADVSKLPKETQGYVKGFAGGGDVNDDYTTVDGMEPSDLYAEAIKRAKAERAQKSSEQEQLTDNQKKYAGLWPYNSKDANKFSYEDAAKFDASKREEAPAPAPTSKPGITYAPNSGIGNVTPSRYVPKESNEPQSEYARQMGNVGGFFGDTISSLGKHIVSAPGYGFSSQGRQEGRSAAPAAQSIPDIPRGRPAMANDPRIIGSAQPSMRNEIQAQSAAAAPSPVANPASPVSKMPEPSKMSTYEQAITDALGKREENLGKQREQDKYMAMLQAGLGMMGGTSQHALANIGAGATQGIQSLAQSNRDRTAEENALLSGRLGLAKIGSNKEYQDAMMAYRKDLAGSTDARARDLAAAAASQKTEDRTLREQNQLRDDISNIKSKAEKYAEESIKADPSFLGKSAEERIAAHKAYVDSYLKRDDTFASLYKKFHNKDYFSGGAGKMDAARLGKFNVER